MSDAVEFLSKQSNASDILFLNIDISEKIMCIFDGSNFFSTVQMLGTNYKFNFSAFKNALETHAFVVRANYYTATIIHDDGYDPLKKLTDYLAYNGYNVITKEGKQYENKDGEIKRKGNMDCEMIVDMLVASGYTDHYILASGDGDFVYLVKELHRRGKRVTLLSSLKTERQICSDELRRECDGFIELANLLDIRESDGS